MRLNRRRDGRPGEDLGPKLNAARGPLIVMVPTRGLSIANVPGGVFWDPRPTGRFVEALRTRLRPDLPLRLIDAHINDARFAAAVAEAFLGSW